MLQHSLMQTHLTQSHSGVSGQIVGRHIEMTKLPVCLAVRHGTMLCPNQGVLDHHGVQMKKLSQVVKVLLVCIIICIAMPQPPPLS